MNLPPKPTSAELDLLRVLWRTGPASARQAHEALREERPDVTEANVLRQLQLMHAKGLLKRTEDQRPHVYSPAQAQDKMQTALLRDVVHKLFAGSAKALVLAALRSEVSAAERDEIARLLQEGGAELEDPAKPTTKGQPKRSGR
ncbi:BlaI/MecI/CopY family transcriptional regulator [Roseateles sp. BYS180W]|uniref:BlaI/MecI/CopY family transcriptional regulator n=1 Tax=Roseateles rivi TaxID=3299028 RepID=A0ABW7FYN3_9BURK